ncbi:MAG: hypothetical protein KGQ45_13535 [Burkholderiales bacterium]|nr:hypothetical protein [Burkholderiales bacterium]
MASSLERARFVHERANQGKMPSLGRALARLGSGNRLAVRAEQEKFPGIAKTVDLALQRAQRQIVDKHGERSPEVIRRADGADHRLSGQRILARAEPGDLAPVGRRTTIRIQAQAVDQGVGIEQAQPAGDLAEVDRRRDGDEMSARVEKIAAGRLAVDLAHEYRAR